MGGSTKTFDLAKFVETIEYDEEWNICCWSAYPCYGVAHKPCLKIPIRERDVCVYPHTNNPNFMNYVGGQYISVSQVRCPLCNKSIPEDLVSLIYLLEAGKEV